MRRRIVIPILLSLLAFAAVAGASPVRVIKGGLELTFDADFAPHVLPRRQAAPVEVKIQGKIATIDGSHPPPLRRLEVALNRNGRLSAKGLRTCTASRLQSTSTETALARCRGALVGRGSFRAVVTLGEEIPTGGKILAFNSRIGGRRALALHLFAGVPVRFTLVVPLKIEHRSHGQFGTVLRAKIPRLAGDLGSVTEINLTIGRRYTFAGKRRSYVSAACRIPEGFNSLPFSFARGTFRFEGHRTITETLTQVCRVR
jgi:hypothetical protein